MGLFSKLQNNIREFNKLAKAVTEIDSGLFLIAWVCKVGIIDIIDRNNWPKGMSQKFYADINGHTTHLTIFEAYSLTVTKLKTRVLERDDDIQFIVNSILDNGEWFYKINSSIPNNKREQYL
jgi:hypothetical protein